MKIRTVVILALAACFVNSSGCPIVQAQAVDSNDSGPPRNSTTEPQPAPTSNVADLDVSQLMNMKVTSVSKKEQKLSHVAAAIFVITQEDIRRSGATNIPDLLRMVPGMDVAQIDASSWAISVRGFNHQFSDKLLVLIDGRAVYTPLFSGVYWDTQDVLLEDIDRIEVIRGPGATVWGANAVNGVINITTLKAANTQRGLITAGGGTQDIGGGAAQYGGKTGRGATYRIFAKGFDHNHFPDLTGRSGEDQWHLEHGGFRLDDSWSPRDSGTLQGDIYGGSEGSTFGHISSISPPVNETIVGFADVAGGNLLSRWHHVFSPRSDTTLQLYFDRAERQGPESNEYRNTFDIDFQHHISVGTRHDIVWGGDYRHTVDKTEGTIDQAWLPKDRTIGLFSAFIQDEIALKPDQIFLTVGTKLEKSLGDLDVEPSARIAWTPRDHDTFWAAISRAGRSPGRRNLDADINVAVFPGPGGTPAELTLLGNPDEKSEHVIAYEAGYRAQPSNLFSVDLALFFNTYSQLATTELGAPFLSPDPPTHYVYPLVWANKMYGTTQGVEISANWKTTRRWTLSPSYSLLQMHLHTTSSSLDTNTARSTEGASPRHQAQLRSHIDLPGGLSWEASAHFLERLPAQAVPSYTRLDTQLSRRIGEGMTFSLVGQNLLHDHHLESNDELTSINPSLVKRSVYAKVIWRF